MPKRRWRRLASAIVALMLLYPGSALAQASQLEVIDLQHRSAAELLPVVEPLVQPGGAVSAAGNKLIVRATPAQIDELRRVLAQLDTRPRNLLISVRQGSAGRLEQSGAGVSGRARVGDGVVDLPPDGRRPNVIYRDDEGNVLRGRVTESQSQQRDNASQQLRVLEGQYATLFIGETRPIRRRTVLPSVGTPVIVDQTEFQEALVGFEVLPRVSGDRFTMEIRPQQERFGAGGTSQVQSVSTSVAGRLGEWVNIGGVTATRSDESRELLSRDSLNRRQSSDVWVKVEILE